MRIAFSLLLVALTLFTPFWLYLPMILVGIILFPLYVEAIVVALLADALYGGAGHGAWALGYPFGVGAAILVTFAVPLRSYLRFNA